MREYMGYMFAVVKVPMAGQLSGVKVDSVWSTRKEATSRRDYLSSLRSYHKYHVRQTPVYGPRKEENK